MEESRYSDNIFKPSCDIVTLLPVHHMCLNFIYKVIRFSVVKVWYEQLSCHEQTQTNTPFVQSEPFNWAFKWLNGYFRELFCMLNMMCQWWFEVSHKGLFCMTLINARSEDTTLVLEPMHILTCTDDHI